MKNTERSLNNSKKLIALSYAQTISGEISNYIYKMDHRKANLASFRMQVSPALIAARQIGYETEFWSLKNDKSIDLSNFNADICLIGKMSSENDDDIDKFAMANLSAIARLKRKGAHIAMIYSDNHFFSDQLKLRSFYRDITYFANTIITPTNKLKELLEPFVAKNTKFQLIKDPWQFSDLIPYKPLHIGQVPNFLWFGSASNIKYLAEFICNQSGSDLSFSEVNLTVLCTVQGLKYLKNHLKGLSAKKTKWNIFPKQWKSELQPHQLREELRQAHFTLIPSNPYDKDKVGISHNRFVDAVRGGTIPIASPMPSYLELKDLGLVGNNFENLFSHATKNYSHLIGKYEAARDKILYSFSPENNLKEWKQWLMHL